MKIISRLMLTAAAAALGFWLWTVLFPSPEKLVMRKIAGLAATVTISARDGNITRASKVSNLVGYFATRSMKREDRFAGAISFGNMNNILIIVFSAQFFDPLSTTLAVAYMLPFFMMIVPLRAIGNILNNRSCQGELFGQGVERDLIIFGKRVC